MDKAKVIDVTFTAWLAALKFKDRGKKHVRSNFEELFQKWKDAGATFDDLYEGYLPKAIKAHQPSPSLVKSFYKNIAKQANIDKTEKEFTEEWNQTIEATGTDAFFEFFPALPIDHDPEPKVYGSMSAKEYKAQRRYAESFPVLDTDDLIKQWKEQQEYNLDIEKLLEDVLGKEE